MMFCFVSLRSFWFGLVWFVALCSDYSFLFISIIQHHQERYGHPFERRIQPSLLEPETFLQTVTSFFSFAYERPHSFDVPRTSGGNDARGVVPHRGGIVMPKRDWSWGEIHAFNRAVDWDGWEELHLAGRLHPALTIN
jgi:hypothetical protein